MKYCFIQNLIAPYRTALFNTLNELGLDFVVLYMNETVADRSWRVDLTSLKFHYHVFDGWQGVLFGYALNWNPRLIKYVKDNEEAKVILGSGWNDIDIIAICLLKRFHIIKNELLFWSEANYLTNGARRDNWIKRKLRSFIFHSGDGRFIVPGQMSVETFSRWKITVKEFLFLPNVIDENLFNTYHRDYLPEEGLPNVIMPVRLIEKIKGIINFFQGIGKENVKKAIFHILGDGEDESMIQSFINSCGYSNHIILEGFKQGKDLVDFYNRADFFVLPSFSDPSPLSIVEATRCGLPLLVSRRCGNYLEALVEGVNGFSFDPDNRDEMRISFEKMLHSRPEWREMGRKSFLSFQRSFEQANVLKRFVTELTNKDYE